VVEDVVAPELARRQGLEEMSGASVIRFPALCARSTLLLYRCENEASNTNVLDRNKPVWSLWTQL